MKKVLISLLFVYGVSVFALFGPKKEISKDMKNRLVTQLTTMVMNRECYRKFPINDELSIKIFDECFKVLDPNKTYISKEDIKVFIGYKLFLDDMLEKGNAEFAVLIHNFFIERLKEYKEFCFAEIEKGFDFTKDETYLVNRKDAERAETINDLKKIWRKKIKNELLASRLMEKVKEEKKSEKEEDEEELTEEEKEEKEKEEKADKIWHVKTPLERIKKRIEENITFMEGKDHLRVLGVFLSAFTNIFDPHSVYMPPAQEEDFNIGMSLSLIGIGAVLSVDDGYVKVNELVVGGPADKAGDLKVEDRIIAVAEEGKEPLSVIDMPLSKVVRYIRGEKDAVVELTILDGDKGLSAIPKVIKIKRDKVDLKKQAAKKEIEIIKTEDGKEYKLGIITLKSFYRDFSKSRTSDFRSSTRDVKKILDEFENEDVQAVVMDLRSNGGGSLVEAVDLTGLFIKAGPVVQIKDSTDRVDVLKDEDELTFYNIPLAVMVNKFSASATEIFAGAIQDYGRGIIIGDEHTHGKGTVQTLRNLNPLLSLFGQKFPAGVVKYTTSMFYRISGSSTQIKGVTPDIVFPSYTDVMELGEVQLENALEWQEIDKAKHDKYADLKDVITKLDLKSKNRMKENSSFKALKKGIKIYDEMRKDKVVSLNEEKRWLEYKEEKKIFEEQAKLMKLDDKKSDKKDKDKGDFYLKETMNIVVDFIENNKS